MTRFISALMHRVTTTLVLGVLGSVLLGLQGCGGSDGPPPNANPTGYYDVTGTATVKSDDNMTDLPITDLQGMVNGNRFIAMSVAEGLVYDGTLTISSINNFSANISIYRDGALITTATASGTITQGSLITGTLTGTGAGNGTFSLIYALSNSQPAALSRVANEKSGNTFIEDWLSQVGGSTNFAFGFFVDIVGNLTHNQSADTGVFNGCRVAAGTIAPLSNKNVYSVTLSLSNCNDVTVNGTYSGLASTRAESVVDDRLVLVVSNASFCIHGDFIRASAV